MSPTGENPIATSLTIHSLSSAIHLKSIRKDTKHKLETNPPRPYREPVRILIESFFKPKP
jgi:hypothetical protein